MTTQPALSFEQADVSLRRTDRGAARDAVRPKERKEKVNWSGTVILLLCSVTVLLPLYVTVTMALKTTGQAVDGNAFSLPSPISFDGTTRMA